MTLSYAPKVTELMQELVASGHCHLWGGDGGVRRSNCFAREPWSCLLRAPKGIPSFDQLKEILEGSVFADVKALLTHYGLPSCPSSQPFPSFSSDPFPSLSAEPSLPGSAALFASCHLSRAQVQPATS